MVAAECIGYVVLPGSASSASKWAPSSAPTRRSQPSPSFRNECQAFFRRNPVVSDREDTTPFAYDYGRAGGVAVRWRHGTRWIRGNDQSHAERVVFSNEHPQG